MAQYSSVSLVDRTVPVREELDSGISEFLSGAEPVPPIGFTSNTPMVQSNNGSRKMSVCRTCGVAYPRGQSNRHVKTDAHLQA